jgi:hypothetical protein
MVLMTTSLIGGTLGQHIVGLNQVVAQEIIFHFLARDVGKHHAIHLDAGREMLAGLADHLLVVGLDIDDIHVLIGEGILAKHGTNAVGPSTGRLEISSNVHGRRLCVDKNGARYRSRIQLRKRKFFTIAYNSTAYNHDSYS